MFSWKFLILQMEEVPICLLSIYKSNDYYKLILNNLYYTLPVNAGQHLDIPYDPIDWYIFLITLNFYA